MSADPPFLGPWAQRRAQTWRKCLADRLRMDDAMRGKILVRWASGMDTAAIAAEIGMHEATVMRVVESRPSAFAPRRLRKGS